MGKDQTAATPRAPPTGSLCSGASHGLQRLLRPSHTGDPSCPSLLSPLPSLIAASASQRTRLLLEGHANQGDCRSGPVPWTEPGWSTGQGGRHVRRTTSSEEVMIEMRRGAASHAQGVREGRPGGVGGRSVSEREKAGTWLEHRGARGEHTSEGRGSTVSPASVLAPPQPTGIDQRPDKKFRQGYLGPLLRQEGRRTSNRFPHSLSEVGVSWCLTGGEGRAVSRGRLAGGFRRLPPSQWCCVQRARMHGNLLSLPTPCFCSGLLTSSIGCFWSLLPSGSRP